MRIYSHSELSGERPSEPYIASPKHLIRFLENKPTERETEPGKPKPWSLLGLARPRLQQNHKLGSSVSH